ncbi:MAG TPA: glutathione S-transferase family protein [Candidatus Binatia bacterium]|jgi:glutathione S-transferase
MAARSWSFYAAPMSYFSAKIRPALQYKKIEFSEVWPTRDVQRRLIDKTGVRYIPVIETDTGEWLQDSPRMLERIEDLRPSLPIFPEDASVRIVAEVFQDFCDEVLVPQALHWRWSFAEQRQWVEDDWESVFGSIANKLAAKMHGALTFYGITERSRGGAERWFHGFLDLLQAHFAESRYVLGDVVTVADYALFGPMFAHFARDPVPARIVRSRAPLVMAWLHEVSAAGPPSPWAHPPAVRETLLPVLAALGGAAVSQFLAIGPFVADALSNMPAGEESPRVLGLFEQDVFGTPEQRIASTYPLWRQQRTAHRYAALSPGDRAVADEMLGPIGVLPYLQTNFAAPLVMDGFRLRIGDGQATASAAG